MAGCDYLLVGFDLRVRRLVWYESMRLLMVSQDLHLVDVYRDL